MRRSSAAFLLTFLLLSTLISTAACSSGATRPANVPRPDMAVNPVGSVFFGSGNTAPITLEVAVRNNGTTPLRVLDVEIASPGMATYTIQTVRRTFHETIAPGETKRLNVNTYATTRVSNPNEPLSLRTVITFDSNGQRFREIVQP